MSPNSNIRANIRDVAKLAGVAVKTVSRVLNNHPYVSASTKAKVDAAMAELGFSPSIAARILAGTKSGQVALIYDNHSPYYMHQIMQGCWDRCHSEGMRLIAQPVDVADPDVGEQVRGMVRQTHVDGAILSSPVTDCAPVLSALEALNIPFVRISPGTNHALTSSVFMDDTQAADDMTTHLINIGHRRIGFIIGHPNHMASAERRAGYERALGRVGISVDPALIADGQFDFESGVAATEQFLSLGNPPTAIFASNDDMASGVLAVAHRRGMQVPEQLSVGGFDDTTLARVVWPPLTTVRQPVRDLALDRCRASCSAKAGSSIAACRTNLSSANPPHHHHKRARKYDFTLPADHPPIGQERNRNIVHRLGHVAFCRTGTVRCARRHRRRVRSRHHPVRHRRHLRLRGAGLWQGGRAAGPRLCRCAGICATGWCWRPRAASSRLRRITAAPNI